MEKEVEPAILIKNEIERLLSEYWAQGGIFAVFNAETEKELVCAVEYEFCIHDLRDLNLNDNDNRGRFRCFHIANLFKAKLSFQVGLFKGKPLFLSGHILVLFGHRPQSDYVKAVLRYRYVIDHPLKVLALFCSKSIEQGKSYDQILETLKKYTSEFPEEPHELETFSII